MAVYSAFMKSLLIKIYTYRIFCEFMLLYPLYNVMFVERGGLSVLQMSTLLTIWAVIILVAEVPSGALADMYPRRNLLGLAQVIRSIGYAVWVWWPTYWGFLAGLALWGISRSLSSGTFEALVYDELKSHGREHDYTRLIGSVESVAMFCSLGSTVLAAPVFAWLGYPGILWGSIAATILAALIAFTLPHVKARQEVERPRYLEVIKQAGREVAHSPRLLQLIAFGVFIGMLFRVFDEYASIVIKAADVSTALVPIISATVFLPVIAIGFFAHRLERYSRAVFIWMLVSAGLALALAGSFLSLPGLVFFSLFMLLLRVSQIVFGARVQYSIQGQTRATITSINSFGVEATAVGGFLAYGALSSLGGAPLALLGFGAAITVAGIIYLIVSPPARRPS